MSIRQVLLLLPESAWPGMVLLAGAIVLLKIGLWPQRKGGTPYCRRCGYNLTGVGADVCPECGALRSGRMTIYGERQRRGWLALGGVVLLVVCVGLVYKPAHMFYHMTDFYQYKPARLLLWDMRSSDSLVQSQAARELLRRLNSKGLADA